MRKALSIAALLDPSGEEARDHGITGAYGVDKRAFWRGSPEDFSAFGEQDCALSGHGDQDIPGTHGLQARRVGKDLCPGSEGNAENPAQLKVIGLDQKRTIF